MASNLVGQIIFPPDVNAHRVWEDPSFIKWKKRDPHVNLHCHDSVEGESLCDLPSYLGNLLAYIIISIFEV